MKKIDRLPDAIPGVERPQTWDSQLQNKVNEIIDRLNALLERVEK